MMKNSTKIISAIAVIIIGLLTSLFTGADIDRYSTYGMPASAGEFGESDNDVRWCSAFPAAGSDSCEPDEETEASQPNLVMVTEITGFFDKDGSFSADPWFSYPAPPGAVTKNLSGEYSVCVYDDEGEQTAVTHFDLPESAHITTTDGPALMDAAKVPISVVVAYPEGAAKIVIQKDGREIYARAISKNAPEVSFTGLVARQELPDNTTITWDAFDADGDELYFDLYYCVSESEYYIVAWGVTGRSAEVDLSDCPGSREGFFYIYATDGVNTAEDKSEYVKVAYKAPIFITDPKETPQAKITDEIYYPIEIMDKQDGWLEGDRILWTFGGREASTTNVLKILPYEYGPGVFTFTCTATNSAGIPASREYAIEILDDESDLPDDWARDEVRNALKNGFIASMTRIDAPVTRGEYARIMSNLYETSGPDGGQPAPGVPAGLVTDCGESETGYAELMVRLGVMDAPNGKFEPSKSMTEKEAATIMYKVSALAKDRGLKAEDIRFIEQKVKDAWLEAGVFDREGPGGYAPAEKLSKKKALVWVSRLYGYESDRAAG